MKGYDCLRNSKHQYDETSILATVVSLVATESFVGAPPQVAVPG
jgi:hypothetical protein